MLQRDILQVAIDAGQAQTVKDIINIIGLDREVSWYGGYVPLHYALKLKQLNCAEELLRGGARVDYEFQDCNTTLLHVAVAAKSPKIMQMILERNAKVDVTNINGETPLHWAVAEGNAECVRLLISYGATIDAITKSGKTPLQLAIIFENAELINILLDHGANINFETNDGKPIHIAAYTANIELLKIFLKRGVNINVKTKNGDTALHKICQKRLIFSYRANIHRRSQNTYKQICFYLVKRGADINMGNNKKRTPLYYAVKSDQYELVKILLQHKCDPNVEGNKLAFKLSLKQQPSRFANISDILLQHGFTFNREDIFDNTLLSTLAAHGHDKALEELLKLGANVETTAPMHDDHFTLIQHAIVGLSPTTVKTLINYGANIHKRDKDDRTILFLTVPDCNKGIIEEILKAGVDVNAVGDGATVLHYAAAHDEVSLVKLFLKYGANPNSRTKTGETPLHCAARKGFVGVISTLIKFGAHVNARMDKNLTPLHIALMYGHRNAALRLLSCDVDINAQDDYKRTPLHIAISKKLYLCVRRLLLRDANTYVTDNKGLSPVDMAIMIYAQEKFSGEVMADIYQSLNTALDKFILQFDYKKFASFKDGEPYSDEDLSTEHSDCDSICQCKEETDNSFKIVELFLKDKCVQKNRKIILRMTDKDLKLLTSFTDTKAEVSKMAQEVLLMRKYEIVKGITLYDIMRKNYKEVAGYLDGQFESKIASYKCKLTYYRWLIKKQIDAAELYNLTKISGYHINKLFNVKLPDVVIRELTRFFTKDDMNNIIEAVEFSNEEDEETNDLNE